MTLGSSTPRGIGLYLGRVVREWDAGEAHKHAQRARSARISHIALCAEALDGWTADHGALVRASEVYRDIGCQVWVYSLPGSKALAASDTLVADRLVDAGIAINARGWILDAEESYVHKGSTLLAHRERLLERASERTSLGVTFYGTPTSGPRGYPWASITGFGWAGWQCYERAGTRKRVRRDLEELRSTSWRHDVVPHIAAYERKGGDVRDGAERLRADLARVCLNDAGSVDVPGVWIWSDASLDRQECEVLAEWAERFAL